MKNIKRAILALSALVTLSTLAMNKEETQESGVFDNPSLSTGFRYQNIKSKPFNRGKFAYTNIEYNEKENEVKAIRLPNADSKRLRITVFYEPDFNEYTQYQTEIDENGKPLNLLATPIWFKSDMVKDLYYDLIKHAHKI